LETARYNGVDFANSRLVLREGEAVGVALIARRGWTSRLAAMAIVPGARRQGAGTWLMRELMAEARKRNERRMVLEVIEHSQAAVALYRGCGFSVRRRLLGFVRTGDSTGTQTELAEVDIRKVAERVSRDGLADLPWQVSGESLAQLGPPARAYRLGDAYVVLTDPALPRIQIRAVVVPPGQRRQGQATRLLRALMSTHTAKQWVVPALCPEEVGPFFVQAGFVTEPLSQLQMERDLRPSPVAGPDPS
jgi:ribosomal protein S18 acetylase RimI-like enzyme